MEATARQPDGYVVRDREGHEVTASYLIGIAEDGREVLVELTVAYNDRVGTKENRFDAIATGPVFREAPEADGSTVTTYEMLSTPRITWPLAEVSRFTRDALLKAVEQAVQDATVEAETIFAAAAAVVKEGR